MDQTLTAYDRYDVRLAESQEDLEKVLMLRSAVFAAEYDQRTAALLREPDEIDLQSRHLLIEDRFNESVVGTYRLFGGSEHTPFYSDESFHIKPFLELPGRKLELSRACVHGSYRRGVVLALLWKGIMACARASGARYLFGLSSFKGPVSHQKSGTLKIVPRGMSTPADFVAPPVGTDTMPPLVRMYMKAGAQILSEPVYDPLFRCYDYFTALDLSRITPRFERRFS